MLDVELTLDRIEANQSFTPTSTPFGVAKQKVISPVFSLRRNAQAY